MKIFYSIILLSILISCKSSELPNKKYSQYQNKYSYSIENNTLKVQIENTLNCPLRIWMAYPEQTIQNRFNELNPILLSAKADTTIILSEISKLDHNIKFSSLLGDPQKVVQNIQLELPFKKDKEYRIIQGNNTKHTHSTNWSKYAIDFGLKTNDTVCSATDGFVVGVIDQYKYGGKGAKWRPYGNFITIYEPNSGLFTQYVHLTENGRLVSVGDRIEKGQAIGLSGKTGQTDIEHLHFNCLIPTTDKDGLKSIPFEFKVGYKSEDLKRNDLIKH